MVLYRWILILWLTIGIITSLIVLMAVSGLDFGIDKITLVIVDNVVGILFLPLFLVYLFKERNHGRN